MNFIIFKRLKSKVFEIKRKIIYKMHIKNAFINTGCTEAILQGSNIANEPAQKAANMGFAKKSEKFI